MKQQKILIIDNDRNLSSVLELLLKGEGYLTKIVNSGTAAIELLDKEKFDLIIQDIRLPDIQGIQLIPKIRETQTKTKLIILSGELSSKIKNKALENGADKYLIKPVDFETLQKNILEVISKK